MSVFSRRLAGRLPIALAAAARQAFTRLLNGEDFTYASAIAYYALVSLFPLLLFGASILGRFTASEADRVAVTTFLLQFFPDQVDLVGAQLEAIGGARVGLGLAGTAVIVWVSLGVFRALSQAVNHAWGVEEPPGFLRHQLVAFTMLLVAGALLLAALAWVTLVGVVQTSVFARVLDVVPVLQRLQGASGRLPTAGVLVLVVAWVHYFVPATKVRLRSVWPGAVLTGLLWYAALAGFSWYLGDVADLSIHGSIATVVTFLFWVYISAVIFLYGVEFTAAWVRLGEGRYS